MPAWQGFWTDYVGNPAGHSLYYNKNPRRYAAKRLVNRESFRVASELFDTLIGATAGGTASASHKRIASASDASGSNVGGLRTIDTITDINRATVSGDVTALKEMVFGVKTAPTTYPTDLSGNGGARR